MYPRMPFAIPSRDPDFVADMSAFALQQRGSLRRNVVG